MHAARALILLLVTVPFAAHGQGKGRGLGPVVPDLPPELTATAAARSAEVLMPGLIAPHLPPLLPADAGDLPGRRFTSDSTGEIVVDLVLGAAGALRRHYQTVWRSALPGAYQRDFGEAYMITGFVAGTGYYVLVLEDGAEGVMLILRATPDPVRSAQGAPKLSKAAEALMGEIACSTLLSGVGLPCAIR